MYYEYDVELLKENIPPETIAKCVKLPLEKVLELKEQITVNAWSKHHNGSGIFKPNTLPSIYF